MFKRFIISLVSLVASAAWATEIPKLTGPVNDYAKILTASEIAVLNTKLKNVTMSYPDNPQIMILTLGKLPEEGIDQYANDVYRAWGIGQKDKDNGVLLVLAPNDRKVRIEVGYGLEPVIPDAIANQIIQHMKPDLKIKNWNKAISLAVNELVNVLPNKEEPKAEIQPVTTPEVVKSEPAPAANPTKLADIKIEPTEEKSNHSGLGFFLFLIVGLVGYVGYRSYKNMTKLNRRYEPEPLDEVGKPRARYTNTYASSRSPVFSNQPVSHRKTVSNKVKSTDDNYLKGLTTGLVIGTSSSRNDSSDSYKSSRSSDNWSSSDSSSSSSSWSDSSSSSSSDSWSGGGGDSGGGGSSDGW